MLPKVKFKVKPLEQYKDVMYYFLNPKKIVGIGVKGFLKNIHY